MRHLRDSLAFQTMAITSLGLVCTGCVVALYAQDWAALALTAFLAGLLLSAGLLAASRLGRAPRPHYACRGCGYDRRGLPPQAPCPECGRSAV